MTQPDAAAGYRRCDSPACHGGSWRGERTTAAPDDDVEQSDLREIVCRLWDDFEPRWVSWSQWWAVHRHDWLHAHRGFGPWLVREAAMHPLRVPADNEQINTSGGSDGM